MAKNPKSNATPPAPAPPERRPLPQGYRQGIITAITVLLGFSLTFFRYWGFEASGDWTLRSVIPTVALVVAIVLQIVALFRSLLVKDDDEAEYRKTVIWFVASAVVLLVGLLIAMVVYAVEPSVR
jgi:hypothetical protein